MSLTKHEDEFSHLLLTARARRPNTKPYRFENVSKECILSNDIVFIWLAIVTKYSAALAAPDRSPLPFQSQFHSLQRETWFHLALASVGAILLLLSHIAIISKPPVFVMSTERKSRPEGCPETHRPSNGPRPLWLLYWHSPFSWSQLHFERFRFGRKGWVAVWFWLWVSWALHLTNKFFSFYCFFIYAWWW